MSRDPGDRDASPDVIRTHGSFFGRRKGHKLRLHQAVEEDGHVAGARLADLMEYTCPGGQCRGRVDGVTLRPDGQHYTGPAATIVARWLLDQVRSSRG